MEKHSDNLEKSGSKIGHVNRQLRRSYDVNFKMMVINEAESSNNCKAAVKYGVRECNVRRWRTQKDHLKNAHGQRKAFRGPQSGRFQELEWRVCAYVDEKRKDGMPISRAAIQLKAVEIAKELNIPTGDFKASLGWCNRMMRRNGLTLRRRTSLAQRLPSDFGEKLLSFQRYVITLRKNHSHPLDQIGNADQTPVFFDVPTPVTAHKKDMTEEDLHLEKHDPPHVIQESEGEAEPETPSMKEEKQEDEIPNFSQTVSVKIEEEGPSDSSFEHLTTKDVTLQDLHPEKHDPPNVKRESESEMPYNKQEAEPEILCMIEKEQQDEVPKSPMIVRVKSEEDEDPSEDSRAAKPLSDHLFQRLTAKGEGRSQQAGLLAPLSDSDDVTSHSSDFNSDEEDVDFEQNVSKLSNKSSVKRDTKEHVGKKHFACSLCDKRFSTKQEVTRHTRTHTGEKPFVCTCCDKRFHMKYELTIHMRTHTGKKPFACSVCGKRFSQQLNRHMKTHTRETPLACRLCDIGFCTRQELNRHRLTCIEEKPFSCTLCDKSYSEKGLLKKHVKTHTEEKPYVCICCGKRFWGKLHLKIHMRIHTGEKPFACSVCGKRFTEKGSLKMHVMSHTGEKPFDCSLCDKRYYTKQDLTTHTRTHTGEKPFACSDCGKRFTCKRYLKNHTKTHTMEKPFS
ncbi:zinc finger protein 649-like [Corythoichthys intestinalis]|uniref:zinc finger protein 649-like n=1 Tax=Corythoichthys intestinalis TaxID=161448 RepID=UPI0025A56EE5|nr:zinc finger protein 649-like [Corythoichthys intestinalis]